MKNAEKPDFDEKKVIEMIGIARKAVEEDDFTMFSSDEDKLAYEHFYVNGMQHATSELLKENRFLYSQIKELKEQLEKPEVPIDKENFSRQDVKNLMAVARTPLLKENQSLKDRVKELEQEVANEQEKRKAHALKLDNIYIQKHLQQDDEHREEVDKLQSRIKSLEAENEELRKQAHKLQQFKEYVHKRLDDFGVPADPEPEKNAEHGCRIEGRLNWLDYNWKYREY